MGTSTVHQTRAVLVRRGHLAFDLEVWQNAACKDLEFHDLLPPLQNKPSWASSTERTAVTRDALGIQRLELPPAVHFDRAAHLTVTSVHAATIAAQNTQRGAWVTVDGFLQQADDQWRSVVSGLLTQVQYALASGYIQLQRSSASLSPHHTGPSLAQSPLLSTSRSIRELEEEPTPDDATANAAAAKSYMGPIVPCSGYPQAAEDEGSEQAGSEASSTENVPTETEPAATVAVQWTPGKVAILQEGGSDAQAVLDSDGVTAGVISWHAPWIDSCIEIAPFMHRLATRFPNVAVMHLDVEGSMASKLFAYEKVMTRAESRRRGAKPVLKDNRRFPCLTLHEPSNLMPLEFYCGENAIDELATELATRAAQQPAATVAAPQKQESAKPVLQAAEKTPAASDRETAVDSVTADPIDQIPKAAATSTSSKPSNLQYLTNGAIEFKQILGKAKQAGQRVVVLWVNRGLNTGSSHSLENAAREHPDQVFLEADVASARDNHNLAAALRVKALPTLQVYAEMKMVSAVSGASGVLDVDSAVATALRPAPVDDSSPNSTTPPEKPSGSQHSTATEESGDTAAAESSGGAEAKARDTTFDPPGAAAKAGSKKQLPTGVGVFWPKMPCLRCGCPWWLGEDWDAKCARCSWSAETDGYDDDSKPLPKFKAKYAKFTALLKDGKTADYP